MFYKQIKIAELCKGVHCVDLGESFQNAYLLAKFGFDTAENEPSKVCPIAASGTCSEPTGSASACSRTYSPSHIHVSQVDFTTPR